MIERLDETRARSTHQRHRRRRRPPPAISIPIIIAIITATATELLFNRSINITRMRAHMRTLVHGRAGGETCLLNQRALVLQRRGRRRLAVRCVMVLQVVV